jgi:hypothetical protein
MPRHVRLSVDLEIFDELKYVEDPTVNLQVTTDDPKVKAFVENMRAQDDDLDLLTDSAFDHFDSHLTEDGPLEGVTVLRAFWIDLDTGAKHYVAVHSREDVTQVPPDHQT